jgi:hypothetical protein
MKNRLQIRRDIVVWILLCLVSVNWSFAAVPTVGSNYALLIGNDRYKSQKWPDLKTAVKDTSALSDVLQLHYGFRPENVLLLTNGKRREILKGFAQLAGMAGPHDSVLIYYAGHGEFDENRRGWWVPVGAEENFDYISNDEIINRVRSIKARHKLLISDSCFSGNLLTRSKSPLRGLKKVAKLKIEETVGGYIKEKSMLVSVQGISSGGNEPVSDGGPKWGGHSIFAYHIIAQLKANQRKYLSASILGNLLTEYVTQDTAFLGESQTPMVQSLKKQGHQGGEFFFIKESLNLTRNVKPVLIAFLQSKNRDFQVNGEKARTIIFDELADALQRNGFRASADYITIPAGTTDNVIKRQMQKADTTHAMLVTIDASFTEQRTLMWNAMVTMNTKIQAYHLREDNLRSGAVYKIKIQKMPISRLEENEKFKSEQYEKATRKVTKKYSKTDLAAYIRSSFM